MAAVYHSHGFAQPAAPGVAPAGPSGAPAGTFAPGTRVQIGGHRVVVEKYLSEGGFAHVYVVRLPKPIGGDEIAVLKRVAVPDKEALASMRTEVETMKKLKGHRHIVTYIDSHASQLKGGGYEVFLLMEYCNGGGLIDFMNTRLQNRLTEPEVLNIFADVAQGVACMHYLKPPLLHRDLKVENVLIRTSGSSRRYKLCDFGSTAPPRPPATNAVEGRLIEDDVQKNTTLQYRSPEMVDVYRRQPIDEKSDIWALGVLLYKLCYYKTPFEDQGQMAILNASFKFPGYPSFSDRLKKLIASLLQEQPQQRPNIYQVIKEVSAMRGSDIPIKDIYATRTHSEVRRNQHLPAPEADVQAPPTVGASKSAPLKEELAIPEITPMRRGRPNKVEADSRPPKPSPSPLRNSTDDPFSALDSGKASITDATFEDISARFPSLDDFSLLHDTGNKFAFEQSSTGSKKPSADLNQRVTNALADDAFALPRAAKSIVNTPSQTKASYTSNEAKERDHSTQTGPPRELQTSQKPKMVSTGTMTPSMPPSPTNSAKPTSNRPIWRIPGPQVEPRSASEARDRKSTDFSHTQGPSDGTDVHRPGFLENRSKSQTFTPEMASSSGVSHENSQWSSYLGTSENTVHRSKSANAKLRPSSTQLTSKPKLFRRLSRERSNEHQSEDIEFLTSAATGNSDGGEEAVKIDSNVEYLKAMEEEDTSKRKEKRLSSGSKHIKRSSMPSVSLAGTKNLLAGRFGEAFRRFEAGNDEPEPRESSRSPVRGKDLTPIAGSEATDGRSDDGNMLEESEEVPPEVRRELERRRLSQEERRVADAAAAYKQRVTVGEDRGRRVPNHKAISIQSKVKSLLDESGRSSPSPTKTAVGYGKYTDQPPSPLRPDIHGPASHPPRTSSRQGASQPLPSETNVVAALHKTTPSSSSNIVYNRPPGPSQANPKRVIPNPTSSVPPPARPIGPPKPQPKPQALRTGDRPPQSPHKPSSLSTNKPLQTRNPYQTSSVEQVRRQPSDVVTTELPPDDEWEANFSKKYPDLAGLELVETEIDRERPVEKAHTEGSQAFGREMRIKDV